jgi:hypothetical protein
MANQTLSEVLAAPPATTVLGDSAAALAARWIPPDLTLTPDTGRPTWDGEPVDCECTLALLASPDGTRQT